MCSSMYKVKLGQSAFFEVPSRESGEWGDMVSDSNVDGEVVTEERIVRGCPRAGWGEGWSCGGDVRCSVVMCELFGWEGVSACVKCDQVEVLDEVVKKFAGSIKVGSLVPKGMMGVDISTE